MSEKIRLDHKIGFQNTFYTKCINVIIDSINWPFNYFEEYILSI